MTDRDKEEEKEEEKSSDESLLLQAHHAMERMEEFVHKVRKSLMHQHMHTHTSVDFTAEISYSVNADALSGVVYV